MKRRESRILSSGYHDYVSDHRSLFDALMRFDRLIQGQDRADRMLQPSLVHPAGQVPDAAATGLRWKLVVDEEPHCGAAEDHGAKVEGHLWGIRPIGNA